MSYGGRIPLDPELSWTVIVTVTVAESVLNLNWGARRAASTLKAISGKSNRHKSQMNWNYTKSPIKSWTATQATSKQSSTFDFPLSLSLLLLISFRVVQRRRAEIRLGQGSLVFGERSPRGKTDREGGRDIIENYGTTAGERLLFSYWGHNTSLCRQRSRGEEGEVEAKHFHMNWATIV